MNIKNYAGQACDANWNGTATRAELRAELASGLDIFAVLGEVKKKNDGRWVWWLCSPPVFFTPPALPKVWQGVKTTEEEAKQQVELIWGVGL